MDKVLHITTSHSLDDIRIFQKECCSFAQLGYQTTLIGFGDTNRTIYLDNVRILSLKKNKNSRLVRLLLNPYKLFFTVIKEKAQSCHFHDPDFLIYAILLKYLFKIKIIYDVHEDVPRQIMQKYWIPKNVQRTVSKLFEVIEGFGAKYFDLIITATPFIQKRFLSYNTKTFSVTNYPVFMITESDGNIIKNNNVCYIGLISEERGILQIIEAVNKINVKLVLCGKFESMEFKEKIIKYSGWEKVEYFGQVSHNAAMEIVKKSKAGIVTFLPTPNHLFSMPNKLFEYMANSTPIIASNFPDWVEIIEKNNVGICVDPCNPNEIADAINYIFSDSVKSKHMGENGRKAVESFYNWDSQFQILLTSYKCNIFQDDNAV